MLFAQLFSVLLAINSNYLDNKSKMPELSPSSMTVTKLLRYAVKGLSGDELSSVALTPTDKTFPDDRRFALFKESSSNAFDEHEPEWLHKENFLCAFSDPEMMATFKSSYKIVECEENSEIKRLLTLHRRGEDDGGQLEYTHALGPVDLNKEAGREELSNFFSQPSLANERLKCVSQKISKNHTHQFGNTSSGVKKNQGDTRTVHLVNAATVRDVEEKFGMKLNAIRFRPNIIVDGLEPWKEFEFIGKRLRIIKSNANGSESSVSRLELKVLSKTVRCAGVGVDPFDPKRKVDIPQMLSKYFPEHGPYLGVYAVIECAEGNGRNNISDDIDLSLSVGDRISVEVIENL